MKKTKRPDPYKVPASKAKLKWYSADDIFKKYRKNKEFIRGYEKESARIALARQIKEQREKRRMTQTAVARKAAMPQSVIARIESGEHSISVDTLARVAHALGKKVTIV